MNTNLSDAFLRLVTIMDELREKCPWDRKQTIQSLRQMTIEETYELADAITDENWSGIREELGDLLLHILFYSKIGAEQKKFELEEVINTISDKLIARHPHIYGDVKVNNEEDVKKNWEKLKLKEGKKSVLGGVPVSLPATVKAMRLQEKAKQVGFEWHNKEDVWQKVEEEMGELKEAVSDWQARVERQQSAKDSQQSAKDSQQSAKDSQQSAKDSQQSAKDSQQSAKDSQQSAKDSQQSAKDSQQSAKDSQQSAKDSQQSAKDSQQSAVGSQQAAEAHAHMEEEFGDLVFSLINYARFLQVDAENALERTNKKFIYRFTKMEQTALQHGKDLSGMSLDEMDAIWNSIKQQRGQ